MDIYNKCLIRYNVASLQEGDREVTGLIVEGFGLLRVYWPHLGRIQPDGEEMAFGETETYTYEGWISDSQLVSCHPPLKSEEDISMWLMLHPDDDEVVRGLQKGGWI